MSFFFFNDTATTEIYTLSLHDALPIFFLKDDAGDRDYEHLKAKAQGGSERAKAILDRVEVALYVDRKSTRLNSSHANISYAVFCLKKKPQPQDSGIQRTIAQRTQIGRA